PFFLILTGKEKIPKEMEFPFVVKPLAEGSSKGVLTTSVVHTEAQLREASAQILKRYQQAALVEEFLPGPEFTIGLLGEFRPKVLAPMEVVFEKTPDNPWPVYSYQHKLNAHPEVRYEVPAQIDSVLRDQLERAAKKAFAALGCRD